MTEERESAEELHLTGAEALAWFVRRFEGGQRAVDAHVIALREIWGAEVAFDYRAVAHPDGGLPTLIIEIDAPPDSEASWRRMLATQAGLLAHPEELGSARIAIVLAGEPADWDSLVRSITASEESEESEETEEAVVEEAVVEDRFTDDELRELLTSVLLLIRSPDEATEEDRARIAGEVDSAVDAVIRRRNEIAEWTAAFPTASATGQRHVEQEAESDADEDADEEPLGLQDRLATPLSTPPTRRRR